MNAAQKPVLILVPFFGAKPAQLQRHIQFFQELGFNHIEVVSLTYNWKPYFNSYGQLGMKGLWTDEIETTLNKVKGPKVIFSFSNPCAAAIAACVRRKCSDILGMVCDSGPSGDFYKSVVGLLKHQMQVTSPIKLYPYSYAFYWGWSPNWNASLKKDVSLLPKGFPILSIQGWKDPLISPKQIEAAWVEGGHLDLIKLNLPEAGHLNGLRDFSDQYRPAVTNFLSQVSHL